MDSEINRFESKFEKNALTGCWIWIACKSYAQPKGKPKHQKWPYGLYSKKLEDGSLKLVMAHRFAYEAFVGPIPKGLQLDHLCRNTLCVNPAHLQPVTPRENIRRGYALKPLVTACVHGHVYTPDNTYWKRRPGGTTTRECRTCRRDQLEALYERRRSA